MKKVSILLSCYRGSDLIEGYIDALLVPEIVESCTLIAVNFPFSHKDPDWVETQLKRYPDLVLVNSSEDVSLYDAWNIAARKSSTEFVCNLNLDDRVSPDYFVYGVESLNKYQADIFSSFSVMTSEIGKVSQDASKQQHIALSRFAEREIIEYGIEDMVSVANGRIVKRSIPHCAPIWRRALHDQFGFFDSRAYDFCADFEFWLRVAAAGKKLIVSKLEKTLFFCGNGTASDRLMHPESEAILKKWGRVWPPKNYKPTHLGERHDVLHFCLNMNVIFSAPIYYAHLGNIRQIDERLVDVLEESNGDFQLNSAPELTVICPVYNPGAFLSKAVTSVLSQGVKDIELLLVDDGSTDGSLELAKRLAEADKRIRVLANSGQKGVSGARNTGLRNARGKYIAFLDSDDEFDPGALRARLTYLKKYPAAALVHGPLRFVDEYGNDLGVVLATPRKITFADMYTNPASLNSVTGKREILQRFQFREGMVNGEDWLFLATVLRGGFSSDYVEGGSAIYRIHRDSTVVKNYARHESAVQQVIDWVYSEVHADNVAEQYVCGLTEPFKTKVIIGRKLSVFAWCVLCNDIAECYRYLADEEFIYFVNTLPAPTITSYFRVPLARLHLISLEDAANLLSFEQRAMVLKTCIACNLPLRTPTLFSVVSSFLELNEGDIQATNGEATYLLGGARMQSDIARSHGSVSTKVAMVMGNGPSAKLIDFNQLRLGHIASVGMNAAYRYWDRIDFRPTYYICMDTVVIRSHAKRIAELVEEGRIEKFFLRDEFKELFPHLAWHERIYWFSQAHNQSELFTTSFITTGSWAIRWMIHEGMELISTIGIDSNYVELLPQASRLGEEGDIRLKITKTPKFNPNYFFSDYQQEGDQYNIPNDPNYLKNKGGLVHVDAIRKVSEYLSKQESRTIIVDCSPISDHGSFPKERISGFLKKMRLSLITSFRSSGDSSVICANADMLILNCANPFILGVHVLMEGALNDLKDNLDSTRMDSLNALMDSGRLVVSIIETRPSYKQIMNYGNSLGPGIIAIANSDIEISKEFANALILNRFGGCKTIYALTRWNKTSGGVYIQGMKPSPPWPEISSDSMAINEKNYFSFDTYIYDAPLNPPASLDSILVGSYGCDTALASVLKLGGYEVTNPCLSLKSIHIDEKERAYQGEAGKSDLTNNVNAVYSELLNRYNLADNVCASLRNLSGLSREVAWIGGPKTMDQFHSIFRALGATAWGALDSSRTFIFKKICVVSGNFDEVENEILALIDEMSCGNVFVEWEMSAFKAPAHICDLLIANDKFRHIGELLYHYQWQSSLHVDYVADDVKSVHSDLLLVIREVLLIGAGYEANFLKGVNRLHSTILVGPYERNKLAHLEENDCIATLLSGKKDGSLMIDVGAHSGTALAPFLDRGWNIYAFEPDEINRGKLLERLAAHKNNALVSLDNRCVSNKTLKGVSFFRSEQSTGISGLSAFHESHVESQRVDTITLAEFFKDKSMPAVDFLKIDTEGHDLFVLQGFPWERTKPAVIECEFEDVKTVPLGYTFHDLARYLVEKGYKVYVSEWHPIVRYGISHDWNRLMRYPCELADDKAWGNLLAFRDQVEEKDIVAAVRSVLKVRANRDKPTNEKRSVLNPSASISSTENLNNNQNKVITMSVNNNLYTRFAVWLRNKSIILFSFGQFVIWALRFMKHHSVATVLGSVLLLVLLVSPVMLSLIAPYKVYFWVVAVMLASFAIAVLGAFYVRVKVRNFAEREYSARQELQMEIRKLYSRLEQQAKKQTALQAELQQKQTALQKLESKQDQLAANSIFNTDDYQPFNRRFKKEHADLLLKDWSGKLGIKFTSKSLAYLAHRIGTLERLSKGRLATPIENVILRVLVAAAVKDKNLRVLEIGTLFGIGLTAIYDYCNSRFDSVMIAAIDPLDGYYGKDVRDIVTDEAISERTFRENLAIAGVPEESCLLIKSLSTEISAIQTAAKQPYDLLIIDGDHSYEGVKADFFNYLHAVKNGGYIIFDDYTAPDWPGVTRFVDESVMSNSHLLFVGASWRSAVFQVVGHV